MLKISQRYFVLSKAFRDGSLVLFRDNAQPLSRPLRSAAQFRPFMSSHLNRDIEDAQFIREFTSNDSTFTKRSPDGKGKEKGMGTVRNGYGVKQLPNGLYEGHFKDGRLCGEGKITYSDGTTLAGDFKYGLIWNGSGIQKASNGNTYEGEIIEGKRSGPTKITYADGSVYDAVMKEGQLWGGAGKILLRGGHYYIGEVRDGGFHGNGKIYYHDNNTYLEGEFRWGKLWNVELRKVPDSSSERSDKSEQDTKYVVLKRWVSGTYVHGRGGAVGGVSSSSGLDSINATHAERVVLPDGSVLEGEWREDVFFGTQTSPDGKVMTGQFADGKIWNGTGEMYLENGAVYEGAVQAGRLWGLAKVTYPDGRSHEGEFRDGKLWSGKGVQTSESGEVYEGAFQEGKLHGQGNLTYPDGRTQEGEFKEGRLWNGAGVLIFKDGSVYEGTTREGEHHGQGKFTYPDGRFHEGEFKKGKRWNGMGVVIFKDGNVYDGTFRKGKLHGQGKITYPDGRMQEGLWKDGVLVDNSNDKQLVKEARSKSKKSKQELLVAPSGAVPEETTVFSAPLTAEAVTKYNIVRAERLAKILQQRQLLAQEEEATVALEKELLRPEEPPAAVPELTPETLPEVKKTQDLVSPVAATTVSSSFPPAVRISNEPNKPSTPQAASPQTMPSATDSEKRVTTRTNTSYYPNGHVYEGELKNNQWHGQGKLTYPDGRTLEGEFNNGDIVNGVGVLVLPNGDIYGGEFQQGKLWSGEGLITLKDGSVYEGSMQDNKFHGQGKRTFSNGHVLEGEFKEGKLWSGSGKVTLKNGAVYEGEFKEEKMHGQGKFTHPDGQFHEGEFREGKIWNGTGTFVHKSGDVYEGAFKQGQMHGQGKLSYTDGRSLEGEFHDGKLWDGKGVVVHKDGAVYQGEVREGRRHGQGKLSHTDGTGKEGRWEAGELVEEKEAVSTFPEVPVSSVPLTAEAVTKYNALRAQRLVKLESQQLLIQEAAAAAIAMAESEPAVKALPEQVAISPEVDPTETNNACTAAGNNIEPHEIVNLLSDVSCETIVTAPVPSAPLLSKADQKYSVLRSERLAKIERQQLRAQEDLETIKLSTELPETEPTQNATPLQNEGKVWSGKGLLTLKDGSVYEGELSEGKRHGQGKLIYPDGRSFEGEFRNGFVVTGTGVLCQSNGNMYGGEFKQGKLWNGVAILSLLEGKILEGEYREGKHHGEAKLVYPDGRALEGEFLSDRLTSNSGVIRLPDGSVYEGELKEGMRHGQGKLILHNGGVWEGRWENKIFVKGTKVNATGRVQDGEWVN